MIYEFMSTDEIKNGIEAKQFSAEEVVLKHFEHIMSEDVEINAFITLCEDIAVKGARAVDKKVKDGKPLGRLAGVPVAIKDNICTDGIRTTCASRALEEFIPPYNATAVEKLLSEDAIIIGKTNMDEFGMGSSNENSAFKITKNPRDLERVPGGSSGGSAAAVAGSMVNISLGSDTGGSIRQPAAFCGVVGMKPTYGLVSRYGLIAFGSSLEQIGPIGKTVRDCALMLEIIQGGDSKDNTSYKGQYEKDYLNGIDSGVKGLKIGVPKEFFREGLHTETEIGSAVESSLGILDNMGAIPGEISLPIINEGLVAYNILSSAEASSNLARYDGIRYGYRYESCENIDELIENSRSESFGPEVKRRILLGTFVLSSGYYDTYYNKARKFRKLLTLELDEIFKRCDLIISPSTSVLPFKIGEKAADPLSMYLGEKYTISANMAGLPAISIPCGLNSEGLPIGLQLIGPRFGEKKLFQAAYALEQAMKLGL